MDWRVPGGENLFFSLTANLCEDEARPSQTVAQQGEDRST
jgi:hypothetical protein